MTGAERRPPRAFQWCSPLAADGREASVAKCKARFLIGVVIALTAAGIVLYLVPMF